MLWLKAQTARIAALVEEGSEESITLAALRCRLAIEKVCYDRLRIAHGYISHADLKRWQPRDVINRLIEEVDPYIASDYTFSISTSPLRTAAQEMNSAEYDAEEYTEIGRQIGFNTKRLGTLWNALGSFLHVRLPRTSEDEVRLFGQVDEIKRKVDETLVELRRLESGTLISSGLGTTVKFECRCGVENVRRASLLKAGQIISCANSHCTEKWAVEIDGDEIGFLRRTIELTCHSCDNVWHFPEEEILSMKRNQTMRFTCNACQSDNHLAWRLMQQKRVNN